MKNKIINLKEYLSNILRTLLVLYESSKLMFFLIVIFSFIMGVITPINLAIWKYIVDYMSTLLQGDIEVIPYIIEYFILHFAVAIINIIILQISSYTENIFSTYVDKHITEKILIQTELLNLRDFDESNIYNMIQKASNESFQRSMSILRTLVEIIKNMASAFGLFVLLFNFSKLCILICIFSTIPLFYISNKILNKWFDIFNERFERIRFAKYLKTLCVEYDNIKELKIFNMSKFIRKKIINIYEDNLEQDKVVRKTFVFQNSLAELIDQILTYLMKGIIIYLSFRKKASIGSLVTYIETIDSLKTSLNNIMSMISQTYEDSLYMKSLFELLDIGVDDDKNKIQFNPNFKKIEFRNVSFKYLLTNNYVIENFNYTFSSNKTYALVGLNGCGKTTLIKLILGLYEVDEGQVLVDGVDMKNINKSSIYKYVSAIFQDFIKYPFDIKTNITLGNEELSKKDDILNEVVEFTGADEFIKKMPEKFNTKLQKGWDGSVDLSLGQWQKLAISRAAAKKSEILILDEPTASIDALTEFKMFNNFKYLKNNKLCILVTHRLSNIKIVDEILVLENGKLKESGTHSELMMQKGIYKELYELQANSYNVDDDK